jgi:Tol biopolymer transport system component
VSVTGSGGQADADSLDCAISANGRYVAFSTGAHLLPADTHQHSPDVSVVYVRDLVTNTLELVSVTPGGSAGNGSSESPSISGDGRWVAFVTLSSDIAPGATLPAVVLRDRCVSSGTPLSGCTPATEVVSLTYNGGQPSGGTTLGPPAVSADGRFVAFVSDYTNFVADDTNICFDFTGSFTPGSCPDVFVRDRCFSNGVAVPGCAPTTERVSVATDGTQGDGAADLCTGPAISDDGSIVAFGSFADNLVSTPQFGVGFGVGQIYVRDLAHGTTELVSARPDGSTSDLSSGSSCTVIDRGVAISGDGRSIAFESDNFLLVPDFNAVDASTRILVHDRLTGANEMASLGPDGSQFSESTTPSISGDGRFVAFVSLGFDPFVPPGNHQDVFVHDRQTGTTERVSVAIDGAQADAYSSTASISDDGHWVCFVSSATNLLGPGVDTNRVDDVFVRKLD